MDSDDPEEPQSVTESYDKDWLEVKGKRKRGRPKKQTQVKKNTHLGSTEQNEQVQQATTSNTTQHQHQERYKKHFLINAKLSRLNFCHEWNNITPNNRDIILQTKNGFLLKTNATKPEEFLKHFVTQKTISTFSEQTNKYPILKHKTFQDSYSAIIKGVELEIEDIIISDHLKKLNYPHRYCKRIIAKANNNPTSFIRINRRCGNV